MNSNSIKEPLGFTEAIETHLLGNSARISSLEFKGQRYWVKQVEQVNGRSRIFKSAPRNSFAREMHAYEELLSMGAPVPERVMLDTKFVVFKDSGPTISTFWRDPKIHNEERAFVSAQAGESLSLLHALGARHGRPVLRDVCWDGEKITFLDFEHFSKDHTGFRSRAFDLLCFVHSICSQPIKDKAALGAAIEAYRKNDNNNVWEEACVLAHRLRWIEILSRPLQSRKDPHAREFKALPKVREIFYAP